MGHRARSLLVSAPLALALAAGSASSGARADLPLARGTVRLDGLAALIEPTAADVEPLVILRSDVELRARLELSGRAGAAMLGPISEGLLGAALDQLIGEVLIQREASRLGLDSPSDERVQVQRQALAQMAGGESRLREVAAALGVGPRELGDVARRRATVAGFLETNLVGTTDVTNAEVERVYKAGGHPFVGQDLELVREPLRRWLGEQRTQCAVRRWVEGLRARAEVELLADYARPPAALGERCDVGVDPLPGSVPTDGSY